MLHEFRAAVWGHLADLVTAPPVGLHPEIPGDLAELPAFVVGLPSASPNSFDGTYVVELDVYVIANPVDTPGRDTTLQALADVVFDHFGGTRGIKVVDPATDTKWHLTTGSVTPRTVTVGDISDYPAYLITIESPFVTC